MKQRNAARYIRAIARTRSISAAANELGISQPALSAYLKKVEKQLGTAIFDRASTPLALTQAGEAYLEYEGKVESLQRDLARAISDIDNLKSGSLSVGGTPLFTIDFLPHPIAQFCAKFPGIDVTVVGDTLPNLARAAIGGTIDVFIATSLQDNGDFDCVELGQERYFLCVPPEWDICNRLPSSESFDHPAMIGRDEFKLLAEHPFIMMQEDQQIGREMAKLIEAYDAEPAQVIHVNHALAGLALTQKGVGVSIVTEGALRSVDPGKMPRLYVADANGSTRTLYVALPKNRSVPRAADEFVKILLSETS